MPFFSTIFHLPPAIPFPRSFLYALCTPILVPDPHIPFSEHHSSFSFARSPGSSVTRFYSSSVLSFHMITWYSWTDLSWKSGWTSFLMLLQKNVQELHLSASLRSRQCKQLAGNYWDTCGSPVIKCLCFFVVFFFFRHKMEKLRNSTQWSLGPQHHDN